MNMTMQTKKDQVISELIEIRRGLLDTASSVPPEHQDEIFLGTWSLKDLLAHLIGWDLTNVQATQEILAGRLPGFYARYDPDWQTYNSELVARYKQEGFAVLLSRVQDSHQRLIELLKTIPGDEFEKERGLRWRGYAITLAGLLEVEAQDEKTHWGQVKKLGAA